MLFQFLIGRLATLEQKQAAMQTTGFQFLIGRLATTPTYEDFSFSILFQFLIGRLATKTLDSLGKPTELVSIPHR